MQSDVSTIDVTVCTVVTPLHKRLAAINHALIDTLNPRVAPRWVVADMPDVNLRPSRVASIFLQDHRVKPKFAADWHADYLEVLKARHFELDATHGLIPGAVVVQGPTLAETIEQAAAAEGIALAEAEERLSGNIGSYQHAAGIAAALARVQTRYAVITDPDLYVVRPDWIAEVIGHMRKRDLWVFGVPWHPRWFQKPRGAPSPHLMVIDLERTGPIADLWSPSVLKPETRFVSELWRDFMKGRRTGGRLLLEDPSRAAWEDLLQRRTIGRAQDTGCRLTAAVTQRGGRWGTAVAVFRPETRFWPASVSPLQSSPELEAMLPEAWCYRPRRAGLVTQSGFMEAGYPDPGARRWEEFMWRQAPFAFHLRGEAQRRLSLRVDHAGLVADLNAVLRRLNLPPLAEPPARVLGLAGIKERRARLLGLLLSPGMEEDEISAILPAEAEFGGAVRAAADDLLAGRADGAAYLLKTLTAVNGAKRPGFS